MLPPSEPVPDSAQAYGRNTQVAGDIVLRYALYDFLLVALQQLYIPLLRAQHQQPFHSILQPYGQVFGKQPAEALPLVRLIE